MFRSYVAPFPNNVLKTGAAYNNLTEIALHIRWRKTHFAKLLKFLRQYHNSQKIDHSLTRYSHSLFWPNTFMHSILTLSPPNESYSFLLFYFHKDTLIQLNKTLLADSVPYDLGTTHTVDIG